VSKIITRDGKPISNDPLEILKLLQFSDKHVIDCDIIGMSTLELREAISDTVQTTPTTKTQSKYVEDDGIVIMEE
jgi:hypothetical protein